MTLTKREAIRETKKLWKEIEKSGLGKSGFLKSQKGKKWLAKNYHSHCPLCQYACDQYNSCPKCPLVIQYDEGCFSLGYIYGEICPPSFFEAIRGLKE